MDYARILYVRFFVRTFLPGYLWYVFDEVDLWRRLFSALCAPAGVLRDTSRPGLDFIATVFSIVTIIKTMI